jgi:hypothetical protein
VWSVKAVRDPSRSYEIHLLRELPGLQRLGGIGDFGNHRFAVPHCAGGAGRALYNDVGQIYLADPALLFDRDMGDAGYLALSSEDTSVMLMDCARLAATWTLATARRHSRRRLQRLAATTPRLFGALPPEWNTPEGDYEAGRTRCLHYSTLATQPWRPFPERFVYDDNPVGGLFCDLERSADADCYQLFSRQQPSAGFATWLAEWRSERGPDRPPSPASIPTWDPEAPGQRGRVLACGGVLDDAPADDLPWLLDELAEATGERVQLALDCDAPRRPLRGLGVPAETPRTAEWWKRRLEAAARRHPKLHWQAVLTTPDGQREIWQGGRRASREPPRVWVLADQRRSCAARAAGLAGELGWPTETRQLRFRWRAALNNRLLGASRAGLAANTAPLAPPWPDLVIAAGRRCAPVAEWIRAQSAGATRTVLLGRKTGDAAERADLAVTPHSARLFPHPRRLETTVPLPAIRPERLADAAHRWRDALADWKSPRIAVLVGGSSGQYRLDVAHARALGDGVAGMAREAGGTVVATTSRRTGRAQGRAFRDALGDGHTVHLWESKGENPYLGLLALADAFVVTADSESMLAETLALGRPVFIYPLPVRTSFGLLRGPREWAVDRARPGRRADGGDRAPQRGLAYLCARLIDRGLVRPTRDLDRLHAELYASGGAHRFGEAIHWTTARPPRELATVAERVRALMGVS